PLPPGPSGTLGSSRASGPSQLPPPPPPLSTNQSDQSKGIVAPSSSKTTSSAGYTTWTTIDTRLRPSVSLTPDDLNIDNDSVPDEQVHSSDDEDIGNDHIPKVNLKHDWWKPLSEEDRLATPEPAWSIPSSDLPVPTYNWASALAYGSKSSRPALSILKMKATYYPDVGLEQMVPDQMWIEEECKYDIAAMICVVGIEVFSLYEYDYMKMIVLRRADLNENIIAERDF
ncbi:hypothetical protein Tco_0108474, partial [Tanacetum coccineum]